MMRTQDDAVPIKSKGRTYRVWIDSLCYQRLFAGVLEASIEILNRRAPEFIERFREKAVTMMPDAELVLITPFPGFKKSSVVNGVLPDLLICAASLRSYDKLPDADDYDFYSYATVTWIQQPHEPMPPRTVLDRIDWQKIASNGG